MKKIIVLALAVSMLSSCASVFGGHITKHQTTKPAPDGEKRRVRAFPLVMNVLFFPLGIGVDFLTGAAYKPRPVGE